MSARHRAMAYVSTTPSTYQPRHRAETPFLDALRFQRTGDTVLVCFGSRPWVFFTKPASAIEFAEALIAAAESDELDAELEAFGGGLNG